MELRYFDSWGVRDGKASGMRTEERMVDAEVLFLLEGATGGARSSSGKASRIMRVRWACSRMRGMGGCAGAVSGWTCGYTSNGVDGCCVRSAGCNVESRVVGG